MPNSMPATEHPRFNFFYFSFLPSILKYTSILHLLTAQIYHICLGVMIMLWQFGSSFLFCTLKDVLGNQHLSSSLY